MFSCPHTAISWGWGEVCRLGLGEITSLKGRIVLREHDETSHSFANQDVVETANQCIVSKDSVVSGHLLLLVLPSSLAVETRNSDILNYDDMPRSVICASQ